MSKIVSVETLQQEKVSRGTQFGAAIAALAVSYRLDCALANCLQHRPFRKSDFTCTNVP